MISNIMRVRLGFVNKDITSSVTTYQAGGQMLLFYPVLVILIECNFRSKYESMNKSMGYAGIK